VRSLIAPLRGGEVTDGNVRTQASPDIDDADEFGGHYAQLAPWPIGIVLHKRAAPQSTSSEWDSTRGTAGSQSVMDFILWIVAVVLVIVGIVVLLTSSIIAGILLIVLGFLIGPGGYSIFRGRGRRRTY
jgi:hypothetical protein